MPDMTAQTAVKIIKDLLAFWQTLGTGWNGRERKALKVAIAALQATIKPNLPLTETERIEINSIKMQLDLCATFYPECVNGIIEFLLSVIDRFSATSTPADIEAARREQT